jgi:hypothetical protein
MIEPSLRHNAKLKSELPFAFDKRYLMTVQTSPVRFMRASQGKNAIRHPEIISFQGA